MTTTVLVTGGAGYIGAHACKALARAGMTPVAFDNLVYGHADAVQWGALVQGDLADHESLQRVFSTHQISAVMHFAAYAYVGESVQDPAKYYRNNVAGTLNLLDAMREHGVDKLVFSSTCATYGVPKKVPIDEAHPQAPINPYGRSKWMIEQILADYRQAYGMRSVSLRYFNAAGADPDNDIGEHHDPETHLIPLALEAAAGVGPPLTVFGNDYPTDDGTCIRDYIHVTDLAEAHVLALSYLKQSQAQVNAFNLGNGNGYSVQQVIAACDHVTGSKTPVTYGARRPGDPPALIADASLAKRHLGWRPQYQDIETILTSAWAWTRKRHGL